ncbi:helix-turn-helix domain-containing protein [Nonomuraea sp. PA05]|uniref:helix-turn-helix domain-containing protein n=1 Tax=Nonomuraea sp. PA05 TaxID=2604466 RepID=UPI0011D5716A|nr:helix-turn-helix domain-containing protein [Nonomuraea sp. PA05]TYB50248.1 helix-turn-helix domain-containing protein [Nonomuraea sp. PA05]
MPQGKPLDQRVVVAILASIDAGKSRNEVAREHQVSASTVSRIAAANARTFDRTKTKNATEAAKADNAALRASTSRRFLEEANRFLDDLHRPHTVFNFGGKDNTFNSKEMPEPPIADKRNLITSAAVAIDKHLAVEKHDNSGESNAAVDRWLTEMTGL